MYSQKQHDEFKAACEPLIKWLNENCHPHCHAEVHQGGAELHEGQLTIKNEKFIKG